MTMSETTDRTRPVVLPINHNPVPIWGMTARERVRRIAEAQGLELAAAGGEARAVIVVNLDYAFDPAWFRWIEKKPGTALTRDGTVVLAHVLRRDLDAMRRTVEHGLSAPAALTIVAAEDEGALFDEALRKRERPFVERLIPGNVARIERASYAGSYKGVTDLLTKYLWPGLAFQLTRIAARIGLSPNGVTAIGTVLCIIATVAFWYGWFWSGLATGLAFMVLDTVDGKLARCTVTSSRLGHLWDHGVDLIHPPIWWWAWATGCAAYGLPLPDALFWTVMATMLTGYVVQRLIEGAFIWRFGMHIHVWERFDSRFRLITARRNPNMLILFAAMLAARPDIGIVAVAAWTGLSLAIHAVRLMQAIWRGHGGEPVASWLAAPVATRSHAPQRIAAL